MATQAHPGSSIVVDSYGQVFFVDTGQGIWQLNPQGRLTLIHTLAYHWMALDEKGYFAQSSALGEFDRGSFARITPVAFIPTLIISSDYPIVVGEDSGLYYVPYNRSGARELVRRTPDGQRSVFAMLPSSVNDKPMQWVNGIAIGPDGSLYTTENDAIVKIDRSGIVSTFRGAIQVSDCSDPVFDTPKLPYLRGLAVAHDGTIYAAANGCRTVIAVPANGPAKAIRKTERPWSPTGVAVHGKDVYVLEYVHMPGDNRKEWIPRVCKIGPDGKMTILATVQRRNN